MSEWFKEAVLKTVDVRASVGSNPTFPAKGEKASCFPKWEMRSFLLLSFKKMY